MIWSARRLCFALAIGGCGASEPSAEPPPAVDVAPTVEPALDPLPPIVPGPAYACERRSDCVLIDSVCGGQVGANVNHVDEVTLAERSRQASVLCAGIDGRPMPVYRYRVECIHHFCTAVVDEPPPAGP